MWKEGWNLWNVHSLGMLVGTAMNSTHHLRYSPWSSSLRFLVLLEEIVVSVRWKPERSLHAFDNQEYLDLEAMNIQLCGGYSLLSDWPASVGKSLLIVPLLIYTTQVSEYLGHTSLNPDQIISACLGSGLPPAFSS